MTLIAIFISFLALNGTILKEIRSGFINKGNWGDETNDVVRLSVYLMVFASFFMVLGGLQIDLAIIRYID